MKSKKKYSINNIIIANGDKQNSVGEVVLEAVPEYQLELGASELSSHTISSLALSLMLRRHATLMTVTVPYYYNVSVLHIVVRQNSVGEVVLEAVPEYQLELGASELSSHTISSLALSLMLRRHATLMTVRVDGQSGEVVRVDSNNLEELRAEHPTAGAAEAAHTLGTTLAQLQGLLPGHYLLRHEVLLKAVCRRYRKILPCAFTPHELQVAKETKKPAARQKPPPHAITVSMSIL
ncbi:hypothetical protein RR48_13975 [Papilio machaon]|uniref:Little elongation complex subunit 2 C-terminal domain-containing protein n=1 Tax=Papilio machaon TaxID=76193 RepID=A0A194RI55_PAPMA|nr:hypothetical protein RR48_13975 [Papilio machaon]